MQGEMLFCGAPSNALVLNGSGKDHETRIMAMIRKACFADKISKDYTSGPATPIGNKSFLIGASKERAVVGLENNVLVYDLASLKRKTFDLGFEVPRPPLAAVSDNYFATVTPERMIQIYGFATWQKINAFNFVSAGKMESLSIAGERLAYKIDNEIWACNDVKTQTPIRLDDFISPGIIKMSPKHMIIVSARGGEVLLDRQDKKSIVGRVIADCFSVAISDELFAWCMQDRLQVSTYACQTKESASNALRLINEIPTRIALGNCSAIDIAGKTLAGIYDRRQVGICDFPDDGPNSAKSFLFAGNIEVQHDINAIALTRRKNVIALCTIGKKPVLRVWHNIQWKEHIKKVISFLAGKQNVRCCASSLVAQLDGDIVKRIAGLSFDDDAVARK